MGAARRLTWCLTLSLLALLSGLSLLARLLPLLSSLSLLARLLTRLSLLARLTLLRLTRLIPRLASIIPALTLVVLSLGKLLHAVAHALHLRQCFFNVALVAGAFAGLAVFLKRSLSLLQLIAQLIDTHGHGGLANPGVHPLPLPQPLGAFAHAKLQLILLGFGKCIAKLVRNGILRAGQTASRIAHLLFQFLELFGHLLFFGGHSIGLLLPLARLSHGSRRPLRSCKHLPQTVLIIGLMPGQLTGLLGKIVKLLRSILMLHPA